MVFFVQMQRIENMNALLLSSPIDENGDDSLVDTIMGTEDMSPQENACDADMRR